MARKLIGSAIRQRRLDAGMRQQELALQVGCDQSYISNLEHGRVNGARRPELPNRLAEALGCEVFDIAERDPHEAA